MPSPANPRGPQDSTTRLSRSGVTVSSDNHARSAVGARGGQSLSLRRGLLENTVAGAGCGEYARAEAAKGRHDVSFEQGAAYRDVSPGSVRLATARLHGTPKTTLVEPRRAASGHTKGIRMGLRNQLRAATPVQAVASPPGAFSRYVHSRRESGPTMAFDPNPITRIHQRVTLLVRVTLRVQAI